MNEVYLKTKDQKQTTQLIRHFMVNMFYGMKITACTHVLTQSEVNSINNQTAKTSVLNSHEFRCLQCLHPINCFMSKHRLPAAPVAEEDGLFEEKDEYDAFEKWVRREFMAAADDKDSTDQTQASASQSFAEDKHMHSLAKNIVESVQRIIKDVANRLLNTAQIGREKLELRHPLTVNGIFHAILSQHIATAHINDACTNAAALWRWFADAPFELKSLKSMRRAFGNTLRVAASYGWSIFSYSHLVCHVVTVE